MATLVLGAVGRAIGGPVAGAIGSLLGNRIDRSVLGGKGREGPRLTELAVQTSSYGSAIPRLYGAMRVAGTVIWSTDLAEARERSGGGKGQPASTSYSYSASFAVLLSGRAIRGVGRVWADGRLLRGSAGDLKVKAALRLHLGGEDQAADPLIASAEGEAPAYRGCAYAVWEDLPLGEWGNRLPSMTWEVFADDGPVTVDTIARDCGGAGGDATLVGFAAFGSRRGVLEVLGEAAGGWWAPVADGLVLRGAGEPVVRLEDAGVRADGLEARRGRTVAPSVPGAVAVAYYDPARDYQAGLQRAGQPGARTERVEMPAVMAAGAAKALAGALLGRRNADRVRRTVTGGFAEMAVAPGALVRVAGEDGLWRVVEAGVEAMVARLVLAPVAAGTLPARADSGRVAAAMDASVGRTLLRLIEAPALDDALLNQPRLTVVAAGEGADGLGGWRGAELLWSIDDGVSWTAAGTTAAPGVVGMVERVTPLVSALTLEENGVVEVALARADADLGDADLAALDRGTNLALAGGELIQWGRAERLGGGRWRLTRLLRGRRGTEVVPATVGAGFAVLEPLRVRTIDLPMAAIGREVRVIASGVGDADPAEARLLITGASVRPPSPVLLYLYQQGATATLQWVRRSRAGWPWTDGVDAPVGEEAERYRVTLIGTATRDVLTTAPTVQFPVAERANLTRIEVRQRGTWAESAPGVLIKGDGL
jgi:hypothetical protein